MSKPTLVLCALAWGVSVSPGGEMYWPRFRGPNGGGIGKAPDLPVTWTDKDYNWKVTLPGGGHSSPVVWGSRIYVTCGETSKATRTVACLATADGRLLWRKDFPSTPYRQHRDNHYASASPAADAQGVVAAWTTPKAVVVVALDPEGKQVWRRKLGPFVAIHGSGSSPILAGDRVVLANGQADPKVLPSVYRGSAAKQQPGRSFVIALDRATGKTRWQLPRTSSQAPYSTPCVFRGEDGRDVLVLSSTAHGVTGVDLATGKVAWEAAGVFKERCVGSPVLARDLVIAGDGYGTRGTHFVAVRPGAQAKADIAYEIKKPVPLVPTPLVKDGRLYLWSDDGRVQCRQAATGKVIWSERVRGRFYGSPVWADGKLYCIDKKGVVFVLAAGDTFQELGQMPLGEMSYATPAISEGVMYLRTKTRLFSLSGAKTR